MVIPDSANLNLRKTPEPTCPGHDLGMIETENKFFGFKKRSSVLTVILLEFLLVFNHIWVENDFSGVMQQPGGKCILDHLFIMHLSNFFGCKRTGQGMLPHFVRVDFVAPQPFIEQR